MADPYDPQNPDDNPCTNPLMNKMRNACSGGEGSSCMCPVHQYCGFKGEQANADPQYQTGCGMGGYKEIPDPEFPEHYILHDTVNGTTMNLFAYQEDQSIIESNHQIMYGTAMNPSKVDYVAYEGPNYDPNAGQP